MKDKGWRSAHLNGVQVVVGSNPTGPTISGKVSEEFAFLSRSIVALLLPGREFLPRMRNVFPISVSARASASRASKTFG